MRYHSWMLLFFVPLLTTPAFTQQQPTEALNSQDEIININKTVDASNFAILRTDDKAEVNKYISSVVELQNGVAFEILPHVNKAVKLEKGSARTLKYKDEETGKTRYFIQVITTEDQMPSVIETIKALDLPNVISSEGDVKYHMRMKYRRASEVADAVAKTVLTSEGRVTADDKTNTLFIKDSVSDAARDVIVAQFYDVPAPQVEFEVLAVEIAEDNAGRVGLDWDAWKGALGGQATFGGNVVEDFADYKRLDYLLTLDASSLTSFLNYTVQSGTAEVVTRTKITASNNRPGIISNMKLIPRVTIERGNQGVQVVNETNAYTPDSPRPVIITPAQVTSYNAQNNSFAPGASANDPSYSTSEKAEGIFLIVEPVIGTDMVSADVRVVVNSLLGRSKIGDPVIGESLIDTNVTLREGQPFSLGTLDKTTVSESRSGIPVLKDIPVIKYLFSAESTDERRSKVFIVMTPTFKNQIVFNSPGLKSSALDVEPALIINDAVEISDEVMEEISEYLVD